MEIPTSPSEDGVEIAIAVYGRWLNGHVPFRHSLSPLHRQAVRYSTISGQQEGAKLRAVEEAIVPVAFRIPLLSERMPLVPSRDTRDKTPLAHYLSSTSGCQDSSTGRLASRTAGFVRLSKIRRCNISRGRSPRPAPRSWLGWLAPHRFAGRPGLLSLDTHQSPAGRHGKREKAARNGMGGVSNGDDSLSPWSELPPPGPTTCGGRPRE